MSEIMQSPSSTRTTLGLIDNNKNKTHKYLFDPMMLIYYGVNVKEVFMHMGVESVFLNDTSTSNRIDDSFLYVVVNHKAPRFFKALSSLKRYRQLYRGIYSISEDKSVVLIKTLTGKVLENFLKSKYSKMYPQDTLEESAKYFREGTLNGEVDYSRVYKVLTKDEDYEDLMRNVLDFHGPLEELDSAIVLEKEIFNSIKYKK